MDYSYINWDKITMKDMHAIIEPKGTTGGLFLGNITAASDVEKLNKSGITAVLTVAQGGNETQYPKTITRMYISAEDEPSYNLIKDFDKTHEFIQKNIQKTNVLVHCFAGVSRSASVVIAYIMKQNKINFDQAFKIVVSKREYIQPNEGFVKQLKDYEKAIKVK